MMTDAKELLALADNVRVVALEAADHIGRANYSERIDEAKRSIREACDVLDTALRLADQQQASVSEEEVALSLTNARRRMHGLDELTAERMQNIGLWPLKSETLFAARALLAKFNITKRSEG